MKNDLIERRQRLSVYITKYIYDILVFDSAIKVIYWIISIVCILKKMYW